MAKLHVLTDDALKELKSQETINSNIDRCYKNGGETILEDKYLNLLEDCFIPDGLCEDMIEAWEKADVENRDFNVAKILYEALKITPLLAADEHLWAYLTHGPLLQFVQKRWSIAEVENKENHILEHWFINTQSRLMRNALASLWWSVEISILNDEDDKYRLTKILFKNYSLRVISLVQLLRSRTVLRGILEWFAADESRTEKMEVRGSFIAKYLNQIASIKQLTILTWEDIRGLIDEVEDVISKIHTKEDYQNLSVSDIIYNKRNQQQ